MSKPRLLIPAVSPRIQAVSFDLYNPGSTRGKLFKWFGRIVARAGLMKMPGGFVAAPIETFNATEALRPILNHQVVSGLQNDWTKALGNGPVSMAMFLGKPNRYQKITILMLDKGAVPLAFAKVGSTPQVGRLIANECMALKKIPSMGFQRAVIPELVGYGETGPIIWLLQTALLTGRPSPNSLKKEHVTFLGEVATTTEQVVVLESSDIWTFLCGITNRPNLPIKAGFESETLFIVGLRDWFLALNAKGRESPWPFVAAHGDFAPWNIRLVGGRIALFDWEYFLSLAPAGWDVIYFIFLAEHLIRKKRLAKIWAEFEAGAYRGELMSFEAASGLHIPDRRLLGLLVMLAIVFDLVPKLVCQEKVL